ncbi:hypothetical protein C0J52_05172 [Blattella germanica]|nr:hypothetical protein C0J52_05172 [Blattella germanica]
MRTQLLITFVLVSTSAGYRLKRGYGDYETIDLGVPEQTTHTIRFPLPVRTVRVTKTVAVPVPVPYPIRRDIPVPVHVPRPVPVPISYPVPVPVQANPLPVQFAQHGAQQSAPVGLILYDAGRSLSGPGGSYDNYPGSTGSTGATIGHHQGSIGVVVGASYGVSGPEGAQGNYRPGSVVSEPVGVTGSESYSYQNRYQDNGAPGPSGSADNMDNYSITKSIENNYDGSSADAAMNSLQNYVDDAHTKGI